MRIHLRLLICLQFNVLLLYCLKYVNHRKDFIIIKLKKVWFLAMSLYYLFIPWFVFDVIWRWNNFLISCTYFLFFDIFCTDRTISPRNNLTGHFLPKFWHILPEISSKKIFVLKGLMNKNFFHFLFWVELFPWYN